MALKGTMVSTFAGTAGGRRELHEKNKYYGRRRFLWFWIKKKMPEKPGPRDMFAHIQDDMKDEYDFSGSELSISHRLEQLREMGLIQRTVSDSLFTSKGYFKRQLKRISHVQSSLQLIRKRELRESQEYNSEQKSKMDKSKKGFSGIVGKNGN